MSTETPNTTKIVDIHASETMKTRVLPPFKAEHPTVRNGRQCGVCAEPFQAGQRTVLVPVRIPREGPETMPACLCHATCVLRGANTRVGEIDRIKDGDGSPFPVLTTDGRQWTLSECDLTD